MGSQRPGMWILVPVVAILSYLQVPKVEGALTISKEVYGPLGGSTTLQCKDTTAVSGAATWYFNTINLIAVDGIKYSEIGITSGFGYNLTIANLRPSDEGNYHCEIGIDAAIAVYLPIEYRPGDSDINIDDIGNIITIKSYPSPTFTVVAKNESGTQILNGTQSTQDNVTDNTKTTTWRRLTSLSAATYTFIVTVSAPGNRIKEKNITIDETVLTSSSTSTATTITMTTTTRTVSTTNTEMRTASTEMRTTNTEKTKTTNTGMGTTLSIKTTSSCPVPVLAIIGIIVSGFLSILLIFIICCCCSCCCLYHCGKEQNAEIYEANSEETKDSEDINNHIKAQVGTPNPAYVLINVPSASSASDKFKEVQANDGTLNCKPETTML